MARAMNVIVTGANRGIGKAICESILRRSDIPAVHLIACSRSGDDLKLANSDTANKVSYQKLDISDKQSIESLREKVTASDERIDVLINNAGINLDPQFSAENARKTFDVNYWGTVKMCQTFMPHMPDGGRIVNVSSLASLLKLYQEDMRERFRTASTLAEVDELAHEYLECVKQGTVEAHGFAPGERSYNVSKALLNAATKILAKENTSLIINACCPGWVNTDMGRLIGQPSKTLEEGSIIPIRLAFEDIGGVSGRYWANNSISSAEAGHPQRW